MIFTRTMTVGLTAVIAVSAACGDDEGPTVPDVSILAGTYVAEQFRYDSPTTDAQLPLILADGEFDVVIQDDGTFDANLTFPGGNPIPLGGTVTIIAENMLSVEFDDETDQILAGLAQQGITINPFDAEFSIDESTGTLTWTVDDVEVDFDPGDGDPSEEPAVLTVVLLRQ